jgi:hypothetical protein
MIDKNFDVIVSQLKEKLGIESAIINKFGIVLESLLKPFPKDSLIPPKILQMIQDKREIGTAFDVDKVRSFVIETKDFYYLLTLSKEIVLLSKLGLDKDLAKFIPNISQFLDNFIQKAQKLEKTEFDNFTFSKEIEEIEASIDEEKTYEEKYSILKDLVKYMSKL